MAYRYRKSNKLWKIITFFVQNPIAYTLFGHNNENFRCFLGGQQF